MDLKEMTPLVIYDNECYLCVQFAKFVNFLAKGRLHFVGHYTQFWREDQRGYSRFKCIANVLVY